jgi:hypothetical protein
MGYSSRMNDELSMPSHFVQDETPEHGLFINDELQMPSQFIQDEVPEHVLFVEDEL